MYVDIFPMGRDVHLIDYAFGKCRFITFQGMMVCCSKMPVLSKCEVMWNVFCNGNYVKALNWWRCFAVFSNLLKTQYIQILADADVHEAVQQVQVRIEECSDVIIEVLCVL